MKPILIVKVGETYPDMAARLGDFEDWFIRCMDASRCPVDVVCPAAGEALPAPNAPGGVIITGSHDMVTDRKPWSEKTADWIRKVFAAQVPMLGVCYGHQLLAHAMGGAVGDNPRGKEVGTVALRINRQGKQDRLFEGMPDTIAVHACHTQSVLELPAGATLLASSPMDPHHAIAIGDRTWGVQFHPEFDGPVMRSYLQRMADDLKSQGCDAERLRAAVRETPHAQSLLRRFQQFCA